MTSCRIWLLSHSKRISDQTGCIFVIKKQQRKYSIEASLRRTLCPWILPSELLPICHLHTSTRSDSLSVSFLSSALVVLGFYHPVRSNERHHLFFCSGCWDPSRSESLYLHLPVIHVGGGSPGGFGPATCPTLVLNSFSKSSFFHCL